MNDFRYIWAGPPIDFWECAEVAGIDETDNVLRQMPEEPRERLVLVTWMPYDCELVPLFMCKADNNGTTYFFCDFDIVTYYAKEWWKAK